jgi:hypothetical protein
MSDTGAQPSDNVQALRYFMKKCSLEELVDEFSRAVTDQVPSIKDQVTVLLHSCDDAEELAFIADVVAAKQRAQHSPGEKSAIRAGRLVLRQFFFLILH